MKVLVTGANGFLGRAVVAALATDGHAVRALVRPATDVTRLGWGGNVEVARADLRAGTDLAPLFLGVDAVVHLATQMTGDDSTILSGTLVGTERLLAAMAGSTAKRLILCSSFSVYGWLHAGPVLDDGAPLAEDVWSSGAYAAAKTWQERMARRLAEQRGWQLTVLRPGFVWGRGNDDLACIGQRLGRWQFVIGPLRRIPLTHVLNCADAFRAVLAADNSAGDTYNVVDVLGTTAARYAREQGHGSARGGFTLWIPFWAANVLVWLANRCARFLFGARYKLPSMFVPVRFALRYKPVHATSTGLRQKLGWRAPKSFQECVRATWGPESEASANAPVPAAVTVAVGEQRDAA